MSHEVPETVEYKCSYCGGPMTSAIDSYHFTDICPHCRGSVLIPRPVAKSPHRATLDELNAPLSGEFAVASFERRVAPSVQSSVPDMKSSGIKTLEFSASDKVELTAALNEHAQQIKRVELMPRSSAMLEPVAPHAAEAASLHQHDAKKVFVFQPTLNKTEELPPPIPAAPGKPRESETKFLSAFVAEKFKREKSGEFHKPDSSKLPPKETEAPKASEPASETAKVPEPITPPESNRELPAAPAVPASKPARSGTAYVVSPSARLEGETDEQPRTVHIRGDLSSWDSAFAEACRMQDAQDKKEAESKAPGQSAAPIENKTPSETAAKDEKAEPSHAPVPPPSSRLPLPPIPPKHAVLPPIPPKYAPLPPISSFAPVPPASESGLLPPPPSSTIHEAVAASAVLPSVTPTQPPPELKTEPSTTAAAPSTEPAKVQPSEPAAAAAPSPAPETQPPAVEQSSPPQREFPPPPETVTMPPQIAEMPGHEDLAKTHLYAPAILPPKKTEIIDVTPPESPDITEHETLYKNDLARTEIHQPALTGERQSKTELQTPLGQDTQPVDPIRTGTADIRGSHAETFAPGRTEIVDATALNQPREGMEQRGDPGSITDRQTPIQSHSQPLTYTAPVKPPMYSRLPDESSHDYSQFPEEPPKSSGLKWLMIAASIALVLGAGFFITKTVLDGRQRADDEAFVKQELFQAGQALQSSEKNIDEASNYIAEASKHAAAAERRIAQTTVEPSKENKALWQNLITKVKTVEAEAQALEKEYEAFAPKNPGEFKLKLSDKLRAIERDEGSESIALRAKIKKLLTNVDTLRTKQKSELLETALKEAGDLYKAGKIKEAADKARLVMNEMPQDPVVENPDVRSGAEIYIKRNDLMEGARRLRVSANEKNFKTILQQLQNELDKLDPKSDEYKPLISGITALRNDIASSHEAEAKKQEEKARQDRIAAARAQRKLGTQDQQALQQLLLSLQAMDPKYTPGKVDPDALNFTYEGNKFRLGMERGKRTLLGPPELKIFIEAGDNLILIDPHHFARPKAGEKPARPVRAMVHAMVLGEALKAAGVQADGYWQTKEEAPLASGRHFDEKGNELIFLGNRLYTGKAQEKAGDEQQKKIEAEFKIKSEDLAQAIEKDEPTSHEVRQIVAQAVRATATEAEWFDHLPGEYVRKVINEGYIENNMPGSGERLKKPLADWREGFKHISQPFQNFQGTNPNGEAAELRTFEDHAIWQIYDQKTDTTTFAIKNPDEEKDCLFVLYDFKGKLTEFPENKEPLKVRMTHQAVGVTAEYVPSTGKMTWDEGKWNLAAALELPILPEEFRKEKGYGLPEWSLPPHVLLIDKLGTTKGIVTPYGRLDIKDFSRIADADLRKKEMDAFLDQLVKVLPDRPEGNYLHLYYRYFFEYILDSPVTDKQQLLGSRSHCGDIHQTTQQSLERYMGGRYVGDCDDLAEFFMTVTRKMGKLSYVMSLPAHAACGWAEKHKNESEYSFHILDTGPPRLFKVRELDKAVEMANRAYDQEGTMRFDPKSLGFLFRFNGEPTRTPYYLSSRMYIDAAYGEAMEKVQSYWHFHFYALGIQTMLEMIEKKGDRVAENCNEVAGLYGQVREVDKSIYWSQESIKQTAAAGEKLSRMGEEFRIATMWRAERDNEKAFNAIKPTVDELNKLHSSEDSFNYLGMRMQCMGLLVSLEKPFEAWEMIRPDFELIGGFNPKNGRWERIKGSLKLEHVGSVTTAYLKMQDLTKKKPLTPTQLKSMQSARKLLDTYYSNGQAIFEEEDDFNEKLRKYAFIGIYYAGQTQSGRAKHLEELLKDGPYPDPAKRRDHYNRKDAQKEDWDWIRLSVSSYSLAIADAIDLEEPQEKWRVEEAVKLCDQMAKAAKVAQQFGSLGHAEYALLSTRVLRAFLIKDWKDLEAVIKETARRDWARITTDISESFGRGARFCTPEEFATQYRMFTKYIKTKPSFFTVVYEAYRADGFKHSLEAAKIACELNPGDEDMKRELGYLEGLVKERLKKEAEKEKKKQEEKKDESKEKDAKPEKKD